MTNVFKKKNLFRYIFRLYWFPLKILYASGVITCHRAYQLAYKNGAKFYALFNGLLFTLFLLNVYWFYVRFYFKINIIDFGLIILVDSTNAFPFNEKP